MTKSRVHTLPVGQLQANSYLFEYDSHALIIDPGDDGEYIIDKLTTNELKPTAILATHGHFDHIMAGFTLQAAYNIPFYIHKKDEFLVERMRQTAIHFHEVDPGPSPLCTFFDDKTNISIPGIWIKIMNTPGHTPGSVTFNINNEFLFVGDVLFADGSVGEVTHAYSDRNVLKSSIKKILSLPKENTIYPGHGESETLQELRPKFEWALL